MAWASSFFHPCGSACCAALQRIMWERHVVVEFLSFFVNMGTRMSYEVPASFKVSFQDKLGNTAEENWVPPLLYWELSSLHEIAVITDFCYSV